MEDNRIVDLYWARSEDAITETSEKYGKYCYAIAYNILSNAEDADESVNDTYHDAWHTCSTRGSYNGVMPCRARKSPMITAQVSPITR